MSQLSCFRVNEPRKWGLRWAEQEPFPLSVLKLNMSSQVVQVLSLAGRAARLSKDWLQELHGVLQEPSVDTPSCMS